jgi:hypothetical protein
VHSLRLGDEVIEIKSPAFVAGHVVGRRDSGQPGEAWIAAQLCERRILSYPRPVVISFVERLLEPAQRLFPTVDAGVKWARR